MHSDMALRKVLIYGATLAAAVTCLWPQVASTRAEDRSTYTLGADDQIIISALRIEELSGKPYRVQPDGSLNLPMVGKVDAAGLTVAALEAQLVQRLKKYYLQPEVTVTITEFRSQPVSVLGCVGNPGVQQLQGRKTLIEVISAAGGPRTEAGPVVMITRELQWGRIPLPFAHDDPKGQFSQAEVSLRDLLNGRDPSQNIPMRPDDVVTIPPGAVVYVMGEVKRAGGFVIGMRKSISVLEAYEMADGSGPKASLGKAWILRGSDDPGGMRVREPVDIKKILDGKAHDVALRPSDALYVPNSLAKSATIRAIETAIQLGVGIMMYTRF
jgi:polysaccharide biosynthesis/export protein